LYIGYFWFFDLDYWNMNVDFKSWYDSIVPLDRPLRRIILEEREKKKAERLKE
jgi:hypothetical protein